MDPNDQDQDGTQPIQQDQQPPETKIADTGEGKPADSDGQADEGRDVNQSEEQRKDEALLAAVKKVVAKKETSEADADAKSPSSGDKDGQAKDPSGKPDATAKPADSKAKPKDEGDPSKDDYLSDAEMASLSPRAKKRINVLWRERQEARERIEGYERDIVPRAEQWGKLTNFLEKNGVSDEEAAQALMISAYLKSDPSKAWEHLKPIVEAVQKFMGQELPEDLQKDVDDGTITQERAQELASLRNRQAFDSRRSKETEAQRVEREAQDARTQTMRDVNDATVARERMAAEKDPDYWTVKAPLMEGEMARLLSQRGVPGSKEAAVKLFDEALNNVNKHLADLRDRIAPRGQRTVKQPLNGRSSATDRAAPGNIYDAARLALEKRQGM